MSILKIIRKFKEKDNEIRLLILGLDNAGKTTVLNRFLGNDVSQISPTVGFNIQTIPYVFSPNSASSSIPEPHHNSDQSYTLTLWDVGGQHTIRSFWGNYFSKTDGLIWVIDSTDTTRLDLCRDTFHDILQHEKLSGVSVLVLANKQDVPFANSLPQLIEALELHALISSEHHWFISGCQAKVDNDGILSGMNLLIGDIIERIYNAPR